MCVNQQCVVYEFKCDLCDADYVGYTRRHLFQRIVEHKHSAIGKHLRDSHNQENKDLTEQFTMLKKCRGKFECLIYEMLFIQEKKPKLNTQSDSIKAKLFVVSSDPSFVSSRHATLSKLAIALTRGISGISTTVQALMANSHEDFIKHSFLCGLRGFHVYKEIWKPVVGELLRCSHEQNNIYDRYRPFAQRNF